MRLVYVRMNNLHRQVRRYGQSLPVHGTTARKPQAKYGTTNEYTIRLFVHSQLKS